MYIYACKGVWKSFVNKFYQVCNHTALKHANTLKLHLGSTVNLHALLSMQSALSSVYSVVSNSVRGRPQLIVFVHNLQSNKTTEYNIITHLLSCR